MKLSKLTLAVATVLGASLSSAAFAIDLYVDTKTKQIFAEPGKNRVKMGSFEQVKESSTSNTDKSALEEVKQDLELKDNAIKALEEKVTAVNEDKKKDKEAWYNKINVGGYTQMRYNLGLSGDRTPSATRPALASTGDGYIGNNLGFGLRRARIKFSGDINDYVSLYLQADFASSIPNATAAQSGQHFAQLRDAYADIHFDKAHEYRIRAGISKVAFGWENLQSSQNRISLDRNDALNSATPDERDLGLMAYWTPTDVQKLWKKLMKSGLKTSGDYGILGVGIYNGQGLNRPETNDDLYVVAHSTYPVELGFMGDFFDGQVLEVGADAMTGRFTPNTAAYTPFGTKVIAPATTSRTAPKVIGDNKGRISEDRVAVHAILFPQPFGLQAEWTWGKSGALDLNDGVNGTIKRTSLNGGYVQAMYKFDKVFGTEGTIIPYVKWQTYKGAWKKDTNSPYISTSELEAGVEYQMMKALELTLAYSDMNRTSNGNYAQADGSVLRAQLQWNY
jgi:hypothetical protein